MNAAPAEPRPLRREVWIIAAALLAVGLLAGGLAWSRYRATVDRQARAACYALQPAEVCRERFGR